MSYIGLLGEGVVPLTDVDNYAKTWLIAIQGLEVGSASLRR